MRYANLIKKQQKRNFFFYHSLEIHIDIFGSIDILVI